MQQIKKLYRDLKKSMTGIYHRHRFLSISVIVCLFTYIICRVFFSPDLLCDTHFSTAYYDRNGHLMRLTLSADEKYRIFTPLDKISPALQQATILYEDKYFYAHAGVNPVSLLSAAKNYFRGNPHPAGASTITMQVARLKYGLNTTRIRGKLIQIAAAIYIDAFYSKRDILEAYLNLAPYGGNIEGVGAASLIYFRQSAENISTIESITLSTIPQNPTKRGLNTPTGLKNMNNMRKELVNKWIQRYPDDKNLGELADMELDIHTARDLPFYAPHFIDRAIARHNNYWANIGKRNSRIITTIDLDLQQRLEQALGREIGRRENIGVENAAMVLINYKTMEVISHIGSANYFNKSIYGENDGVYARRSPGSTLKPLIYAAAVDMGKIHGMTLLKDSKINFGVYAPENSDNEFYGPVLARDALAHSRNIPAINLLRQIGPENFYNLLSESGVSNLRPYGHYGISIALGGAEVSMLELARIYATMANLGMKYNIKTEQSDDIGPGDQLLSPEAFFIVLDMLSHQAAPSKNIPFAKSKRANIRHYWKTGTSSSFRDAWTAGIFGDYVLVVWVGNFTGQPNNSFSGARVAAPIYFALSDVVIKYTNTENNNFLRPDLNISQIDMCADVGGIAGTYCPKTVKSYFIPGKSPIDTTSVYRAIPIDKKTGRRACSRDPETTYMKVYEFWDSEFLDMFNRAGIRRNTPPAFLENCNLDEIASMRPAPIITSPADGTRTVITTQSNTAPIAFVAITDSPNTKIFWFLDDKMIGTTQSGETLMYDVIIGDHRIRAMDELGTGAASEFLVIK